MQTTRQTANLANLAHRSFGYCSRHYHAWIALNLLCIRLLRHIMFLPGTRARYTRTGGGRVLARIIGESPYGYGDAYRTIGYSRPSEDGQKLHIIDHNRASVLVLEPGMSIRSRPPLMPSGT